MSDSPASASATSSGIRRTAPAVDEMALLAQAQAGSAAAFDELITIHQEKIARLVQRLLGWQSDVEDVVQDAFLDALVGLKKFDGRSTVLTWLTRLAINRCRSQQRKAWFRKKLHLRLRDNTTSLEYQPADHSAVTKETAEQIYAAIRKLAQRDREIIVLRYLEELPVEQIAAVLNLGRGTVDVRLTRARRRLEKLLKPILKEI
ncbi:MAG TPA: sigma-70 family RNA polymerase sigma factor [Pirellulales bacterium]|nr:sigma-70 family RNA polymerase sigma factor [Pirellulales bacterium]